MPPAADHLEFVISWEGAANARIHYLLDNDRVIATEADNLEGAGSIVHPYQTRHSAVHVLEWSLWFPGKTLRRFVAKASLNGGKPIALDAYRDEKKHHWHSRGALP